MSNNIFSDTQVIEDTELATQETEEVQETPDMLSPDWSDYVLSLFADDELVDGDTDKPKPLVAGLRRIAELLIGPIVVSGPTQVFPATEKDHPGRATVVFTVQFENGKVFSEVADCYEGNTDDAFVVYNTATASTRAEARALRKALKLRAVSAEEVTSKDTAKVALEQSRNNGKSSDGEFTNDAPRSAKQDSFINTLCDRAGVDREQLFKVVFDVKDDNKLSKRVASQAIDALNSYINGEKEIPEEVQK